METYWIALIIIGVVMGVIGTVFGMLAFFGIWVEDHDHGLNDHQWRQLSNIRAHHDITADQWSYVSTMDQHVHTDALTTFNTIHNKYAHSYAFASDTNCAVPFGPRQVSWFGPGPLPMSALFPAPIPPVLQLHSARNFKVDSTGMLLEYEGTEGAKTFLLKGKVIFANVLGGFGISDPVQMHSVINGVTNTTRYMGLCQISNAGGPGTVDVCVGYEEITLTKGDTVELAFMQLAGPSGFAQVEGYEMTLDALN